VEKIKKILIRAAAVLRQQWLYAVLAVYAAMVAWYFLVSDIQYLKYIITIGGVALGTAVRETVDKQRSTLRLLAIMVPAVVIACVQAHDSFKTSRIKQAERLQTERERARDIEAELRELLVLSPRDTIDAIANADRGFLAKADALAFRASLKDAYTPEEVARLQRLETSYREAAVEFAQLIKPQYERMRALDERRIEQEKEFRNMLHAVIERVAELGARYRVAGLYNHAAVLAQAAQRPENALAYSYHALALEPDHLPAYESIGYALWVFNQDAFGALKYAESGLLECRRQREQLGKWDGGNFKPYLDRMESRLRLQYAYFSAIQFQNEKTARRYAGEEFASTPDDAEVQDTWGYVQLRFASNIDEIAAAKSLFTKAVDNPTAERITKALATAHLQQADRKLIELSAYH
jgi:hypothetical protein